MPPNKSKYSQAGNVFVIILAGVFLFGALMFTFSRSAQKGTGNLTKQQAKIAAQEILNYARLVEGAVDRVRRNGCSESEINFNNAFVSGFSNPSAPVDGSCDIFSSNGGKIEYTQASPNALNSEFSSDTFFGYWIFRGGFVIDGAETTNPDLIIQQGNLKQEVCTALNDLLDIPNIGTMPPTDENSSTPFFTGTFPTPATDSLNDDGTGLGGRITACRYRGVTVNKFQFYHTLLAR